MHVGVNGVIAVLLQFIGFDLVHQSDAATFLIHIDKHALAFFLNHLHRHVELLATFASH